MVQGENRLRGMHPQSDLKVSKSRSGFTADGFVIVMKTRDGQTTPPKRIAKEVAIEIARRYAAKRTVDPSSDLTVAAVEYLCKKCLEADYLRSEDFRPAPRKSLLIDPIGPSPATPSPSQDAAIIDTQVPISSLDTQPSRPSIQPRYFPAIDVALEPKFTPDMVDDLAFVLSGVHPDQRKDPIVVKSGMALKQLIKVSLARVSAGSLLKNDHWYVLSHLHQLEPAKFYDVWEEAQSQASGQDNTNTVKLLQRLEKFEIDPLLKSLEDGRNLEFFCELRERSVELLARIARRTRRKIETLHGLPDVLPTPSWRDRLPWMRKKPAPPPTAATVLPEVQAIVADYLDLTVKLGRILRSSTLQRAKQ